MQINNSDFSKRWITLSLLILFTLAGLFLRLSLLGSKELWRDELDLLISAMTGFYAANAAPLPTLIHRSVILAAGNAGEIWLRIPSVVFGVLSIPMIYGLGRAMANNRVGLMASALAAFSPYAILYSQMARPYSLLIFLCALTYYCFMKAYFEGVKNLWWLYGAAMVALHLTHLIAIHVSLGLFLFVLSDYISGLAPERHDRSRNFLILTTAAGLVGLVWVQTRSDIGGMLSGLYQESIIHFLRHVFYSLGPISTYHPTMPHIYDAFAFVFLVLSILGCIHIGRLKNWSYGMVVPLLSLLSLSILFVTMGEKAYWTWGRYMSQIFPLFLVAVAAGWDFFRREFRPWIQWTWAPLILLLMMPGHALNRSKLTVRTDRTFKALAQEISENESKLSAIIVFPRFNFRDRWITSFLSYYYKGSLPIYIWSNEIFQATSQASHRPDLADIRLPELVYEGKLPPGLYAAPVYHDAYDRFCVDITKDPWVKSCEQIFDPSLKEIKILSINRPPLPDNLKQKDGISPSQVGYLSDDPR